MKTIGLLGGMSWESSAEYYRIINTEVRRRLGGTSSAELAMYSFDFARIERLQAAGRWEEAAEALCAAAAGLERAGAECLLICTNTMHRMADDVARTVEIPLIHIADATAEAIGATDVKRPLLLGTRYTMEAGFYAGRLRERHGIDVEVPNEEDRSVIHEVIYGELVQGVVSQNSKAAYLEIIDRSSHVDGVIAGCTEIELLIGPDDVAVPYFPTARIHALAAVDFALT
jgi:aspartate racemase